MTDRQEGHVAFVFQVLDVVLSGILTVSGKAQTRQRQNIDQAKHKHKKNRTSFHLTLSERRETQA
jgi:hypothetical protein